MMNSMLAWRGSSNTRGDALCSIISGCPLLSQQRWPLAASKSPICLRFPSARRSIVNQLRNGDVGSMGISPIQPLKGVFPAGMRRSEVKLPGLLLHLLVEELVGGEESKLLVEMVGSAVGGGVTIVALEAQAGSEVTDSELYFAACLLKENLRGRAKLMVVERADIAAAVGADGVLLSHKGLPTVVARRMMQNALSDITALPLVARRVTSIESAQTASTEGADFVILKIPESINGVHLVKSISKLVSIPIFVETSVAGNSEARGISRPSLDFLEVGANGLVLTGYDLTNAGSENVFDYVAALNSTLDLAVQQWGAKESDLDADSLVEMPYVSKWVESHDALGEVSEEGIKLDQQENKILQEERLLLSAMIDIVKEASTEIETSLLADAVAQLDELFLLVVVGEFNSGKSSLINAILGNRFLKEGVLPTTNEITLLKHSSEGASGEERSERHPDGHFLRYLSVELLKQLNVVDTPGTNVILQRQQRLTEEFVPRADLVLFVLAVDKPLSESEMIFLRYIRQWEKKIVFILNKIDVLFQPSELEEVKQFVDENIRRLLSIDQVLVFPVSARYGLQAKLAALREDGTLSKEFLCRDYLWQSSGLEPLESFINSFLERSTDAGAERMRLKLETPLSIAAAVLGVCERRLSEDASKAEDDLQEIARFEEKLQNFKTSLNSEFVIQIQDALAGIEAAKERTEKFIDSVLQLSNVESNAKYLFRASQVQHLQVSTAFRTEVIGSAYSDLERALDIFISWLESNISKQLNNFYDLIKNRWQDVKIETGKPEIVSSCKTHFSTQSSLEVLKEFDLEAAEIVLEQEIKEVVLETFGGLGAAGLSASVLTSILPTTLEDLLALGLCSAGGFVGIWNLPLRRADIKKKVQRVADSFGQKIKTAMQNELEYSLEEVKSKLDSLTRPYHDSAQAELDRVTKLQSQLRVFANQLTQLRQRVQNIGT